MELGADTWDSIRESLPWLAPLATIIGVGVGVYVRLVRPRLKRPSLSMHFDGQSDDAVEAGVGARSFGTWQGGPATTQRVADHAAYLRLRVRNRPGRDTAQDVEVLVEGVREVERRPGNPPASGAPSLGNLPLPWSSSDPTTTRMNIPSGVERHVDLAHVIQSTSASRVGPLVICVHPPPVDGRHEVRYGRTEIRLVVSARNADARRYRVVVAFDGMWSPDVWEHLKVEKVERI